MMLKMIAERQHEKKLKAPSNGYVQPLDGALTVAGLSSYQYSIVDLLVLSKSQLR